MKTFVISLGGSLIVPDDVDSIFLRNFKKLIESYSSKGCRFGIICGGGKIARRYMEAAFKARKLSNQELDWIGTYATQLNANLVRVLFGNNANDEIIINPNEKIRPKKKILVAGGWKPGWSTDFDAVLLAKNLESKVVVNMSNVDYVYDKDPKKSKNAKPIKNICWRDFRNLGDFLDGKKFKGTVIAD